ncbi:hypothetical protein GCM10009634_47500 [Saccharothrix xinjiangensis]
MLVSTPPDEQPQRPSGGTSADPAARPSRRTFTAEYELALVAEHENAPNREKGATLRREGLHSSHVIEWTRARDAGRRCGGVAEPAAPAGKSAEQVEWERLRRQNAKPTSDLWDARTLHRDAELRRSRTTSHRSMIVRRSATTAVPDLRPDRCADSPGLTLSVILERPVCGGG